MKRIHTNDYEGRYFLTVPEVCSLFSYSPSTLKRREKSGKIPPRVKISERRVGYQKDLIFKVLEGMGGGKK